MTCRRLKRNVEYILKSVFQKNFQRSFERKIVLISWPPTLSQWQLKWTIHSQLKEACTIAFMVPKTDILPWNTLHAQSGDLYSSKKVLSTKFKTITIWQPCFLNGIMLDIQKTVLACLDCYSGKSSLNLMSLFTYLLKGCYQRLMPLQAWWRSQGSNTVCWDQIMRVHKLCDKKCSMKFILSKNSSENSRIQWICRHHVIKQW